LISTLLPPSYVTSDNLLNLSVPSLFYYLQMEMGEGEREVAILTTWEAEIRRILV
jgi:hypothetical protein